MSAESYYVEIYETATGVVEKRMGPMTFSKAEKVIAVAERNMNHETYSARIVGEIE